MHASIVVKQTKHRVEGGEAKWELEVYVFPKERDDTRVALVRLPEMDARYRVHLSEMHKPRIDMYAFRVAVAAPLECINDADGHTVNVLLEYFDPHDSDHAHQEDVELDDLCVRTLKVRPEADLQGMLDHHQQAGFH